jgi:hypothetical protein
VSIETSCPPPPPKCDQLLRLRCPDDVSDGDVCERGVPGGALNLSSSDYSDHDRCANLPLKGKIPTEETGIEPGTSWLVVRSSDHQATRLVSMLKQNIVKV